MENRIAAIREEPMESRQTRKLDALPMRDILDELFVWCQRRFPEFSITAVEMQGDG